MVKSSWLWKVGWNWQLDDLLDFNRWCTVLCRRRHSLHDIMDCTWAWRWPSQARPLRAWSQAELTMTTMHVALLALPANIYWEKLPGWDLPRKSWEATSAKVHGVKQEVSEAIFTLESVVLQKQPCDLCILSVAAECSWSPVSSRTSRGICSEWNEEWSYSARAAELGAVGQKSRHM